MSLTLIYYGPHSLGRAVLGPAGGALVALATDSWTGRHRQTPCVLGPRAGRSLVLPVGWASAQLALSDNCRHLRGRVV